jgi:hypothetical protein
MDLQNEANTSINSLKTMEGITMNEILGTVVRTKYACLNVVSIILLGCFLMFLTGCSDPMRDFESVQREDTIDSYTEFLKRYPNSKQAPDAQKRMEYLSRIATISHALDTDDVDGMARAMVAMKSLDKSKKLDAFVPILINLLNDDRRIQIIEGLTFIGGLVSAGEEGGSIRFTSVADEAAEALKFITGQPFGNSKEKWENWWREHKDSIGR